MYIYIYNTKIAFVEKRVMNFIQPEKVSSKFRRCH